MCTQVCTLVGEVLPAETTPSSCERAALLVGSIYLSCTMTVCTAGGEGGRSLFSTKPDLRVASCHQPALQSCLGRLDLQGWRSSSPLPLLTCSSCPGIGDQGNEVGPCPPLSSLMLVSHGPAIPCSLELVRTCSSGGVQLLHWAPFKSPLSVLGCALCKTQGTEMNLLPSPTMGPS